MKKKPSKILFCQLSYMKIADTQAEALCKILKAYIKTDKWKAFNIKKDSEDIRLTIIKE